MILRRSVVCFILALYTFMGCRSSEEMTKPISTKRDIIKDSDVLKNLFKNSKVFTGNFTGFMLYDPQSDRVIYAQNEAKYFTPASNTKLFTFYTGLKMLPDSIPAIQYAVRGDSLIFRGTGAPSFLHPDFGNNKVYEFFKNSKEQLYYTDDHFDDDLLGPGWAWSDYNYSYSTEKSPFPMYGNVVRLTVQEIEQVKIASDGEGLKVSPVFFRSKINATDPSGNRPLIARDFSFNNFNYIPKADTSTYTIDKPFHYTPGLITGMLQDTLGKPVNYISVIFPDDYETVHSIDADTVYKRMLQPSDNFIAEQLLLVSASQMGQPLSSGMVIEYMKKHYLAEMPDEPQWVDGSGLSRYNMFTPRSMIWLLQQIDDEFADDRELFALFPAGGESGTIRDWYAAPDGGEPYVFAKTGTLSNNHCLSGFIVTERGRKLIFSFMNNHYVSSSSVIKQEMEKVLEYIREVY